MGHRHGEATRLRHALAAAGTTRAAIGTTVGTTPEPAVPRATTGDAWANVAAVVREWRKAVASARSTWDGVTQDATCLRDACGAVATAGATAGTTAGHLAAAVAREDRARRQLLLFTQELPVATDVATAVSEVAAHGNRVAEACAGLCAATEATERTAVAMVGTAVAAERRRRAAAAGETLERLVAACHGVTRFYCHLQHLLKAIEASVAVTAAGCGGPEGGRGGPQAPGVAREAPGVAREAPGVPEDLMPAVAAAEMLWDASAHLAQGHLLKTLGMARGLLVTSGVPDATAAATVAQNCRDATAALPGLLRRGRR
ncbi:uncharacterized protein LOC142051174 [Phalacrocorax aristotelis]|uniref:uncharacterized protein LOC142051174 n=1 Tax=Phalacrocorax aristotelis TaxID=126867 RepID=UPI003F4B46B8